MPDYDSLATQSTIKSHQEVYGMSEGSFNDHNDQPGLAHTHCAVLVLAKKRLVLTHKWVAVCESFCWSCQYHTMTFFYH